MSEHVRGEPTLAEVKMNLSTPATPCVGTVVSTERCTASRKAAGYIRHVAIDVSGTPLAGNFASGQAFGVLTPGVDANGKPHKLRLYSIASPSRGEDGAGNVLATTVKRTIDEHDETHKLFLGVCSNYLCDLQVGDKVSLTGPSGKKFVLPADRGAHDYVFVATGTGIAPFRGMIMDLLASGVASRVALVMGSPYSTDLLYHQQFEQLAATNPNFVYRTAISRERGGSPPMYAHDRIIADRDVFTPMLESDRCLVYVCGIAGMELGVLQALSTVLKPEALHQFVKPQPGFEDAKGWDRKMLHRQLFVSRRVLMEVY
jgi:ferredoxin--NADP+ reductase